nr:hypothetical protein [uncultured Draconibacterium sp.]
MKRAITNQSHENKKQYDCELHQVPLKTKNENEMKTKNNVQKAVLRSAAVVVSFVLISFTVSAQTFWKRLLENTGFSDIAIAMAAPAEMEDVEGIPVETEAKYYFVNEVESAMEVEAWMTDDSRFTTTQFEYSEAAETNLEVEDWMMNETFFQPVVEEEAALELEAWMVSENTWAI